MNIRIYYMLMREGFPAEPHWEEHCQIVKVKYSEADNWFPSRLPMATEEGKSEALTYPSKMG